MANSTYLRDYFAYKKVPVYLESKVKAIGDKELIVTGKDGKDFTLPADSTIMDPSGIRFLERE